MRDNDKEPRTMFTPVVLAGGRGTRLWPLSNRKTPKQFLPLTGERTMLQETLCRLDGLDHQPPLLICNTEHRALAAEQLQQIGKEDCVILLEPEGRNTAPAIALAALQALSGGEDPVLLILAADHLIQDVPAFQQAVAAAMPLAEQGSLVTFGIVPTEPNTGYGYIERGEACGIGGYRVQCFEEKPDAKTAAGYIASGNHFWNSGMFVFRASRYLEELKAQAPAIVTACEAALSAAQKDLGFIRIDAEAFARSPYAAIDTAVLEKTDQAVMVPLDAGWRDIGSWAALREVLTPTGPKHTG